MVLKIINPMILSNQARALKLLEAAGLIKLKKDFGLAGTAVKDITSNPKHLKITAVMHSKLRVLYLMSILQLLITVLALKRGKTLKMIRYF